MKVVCCQEHIEDVAYCLWSCVRASKPAGCDGILGVSTLTNRKPCHDLSWPIRAGPAPSGYQVSESCQSGSICLCQDIPQSVRLLGDWAQPLISHEIPEQLSSENLAPLPVRASYLREGSVISPQCCHAQADRWDSDVWQQTSLWSSSIVLSKTSRKLVCVPLSSILMYIMNVVLESVKISLVGETFIHF